MQVETYMQDETTEMVSNDTERQEWQEQVERLGLSGQLKLVGKKKTPLPFIPMTREEIHVYRTCFPSESKVDEFSKEVIPLRVLSVIAFALSEQYFTKIHVWSDPTGDDPVVVGEIEKSGPNDFYLLARWGRALVSYAELRAEAIKILTSRFISKTQEEIQVMSAKLANPTPFIEKTIRETVHYGLPF